MRKIRIMETYLAWTASFSTSLPMTAISPTATWTAP